MKAIKLISTVLAASAVAGGISVAVAQNAMPNTPAQDTGTKKDIEATGAMRPMSPTPAPTAAGASSSSMNSSTNSSSGNSSSDNSSSAEPAAQPTRG